MKASAGSSPPSRIRGADQRLDDVADDIVAHRRAVVAGLLAEPDQRRNAECRGRSGRRSRAPPAHCSAATSCLRARSGSARRASARRPARGPGRRGIRAAHSCRGLALEWVNARSNSEVSLGSWPSVSRTKSAIALTDVDRLADAVAAKRREPGPRQPIIRAAVGRPEVEQPPADDILDGNEADPAFGHAEAAVEAVVAIVAHQEQMAGGDGDRAEIVGARDFDLVDDELGRARREASRDRSG